MKNYVDKDKLQEYTTKLTAKNKTIFATKSEVGSPLVASTAAAMTDTSRVYVYTGSESGYTAGNWYYYDGTAWTSGGVYNSTAFETDTTLAIPGKAADAKAVGDALANVEIEVDAIGEVEDEVSDLKTQLTNASFDNDDLTNTGYYIGEDGKKHANANFSYSDFMPALEGMKYTIKAPVYANTGSAIAFYADNTFDSFISGISTATGNDNISVIAPKFTKYVVFCSRTTNNFKVIAEILTADESFAESYNNSVYNKGIVISSDFTEAGYISTTGEIAQQSSFTHTPLYKIPKYATKITIMRSRAISSGCVAAFYRKAVFSADSFISGYTNSSPITDEFPVDVIIPYGAEYMAFCAGTPSVEAQKTPCILVSGISFYKNNYGHMTFSVIGDSYTAYPGWIPNGNESFFPANSQTVKDFKKMWWYRLAERMKMHPLIIDGYSGATISTNVRSEHSVDVAYVNRIKKSMGEERTLDAKPSIIFVMGGQNDNATGTTTGSVKYSDWTTEDLNQFAPAFCYMIDYLQRYNPGCEIVNITNTGGVTSSEATAMETACAHYGIKNIVLHDIDKVNAHPTDTGMKQICEQVIAGLMA